MPTVHLPTVIHIGTRNFWKQGKQFVYNWLPVHNFFMCDKTTDSGLPGENLVIMIADSSTGPWYVAVEGVLTAAGFQGRRAAFRTQEEFWRAAWHEWQVNQNNSGGDPDWDTRDHSHLYAETRIPGDAGTVALNEGLQLALTD
jgi:hypothetical protein